MRLPKKVWGLSQIQLGFLGVPLALVLVILTASLALGKTFPIKGHVYCYSTGKPAPFSSIDITCPGITSEKGDLLIKGQNIPIYAIQEIAFPKYPQPAIKIKLKNGSSFRLPAKKADVPLCIFTFKVSGGLLPLDSFDIDRVVFR